MERVIFAPYVLRLSDTKGVVNGAPRTSKLIQDMRLAR